MTERESESTGTMVSKQRDSLAEVELVDKSEMRLRMTMGKYFWFNLSKDLLTIVLSVGSVVVVVPERDLEMQRMMVKTTKENPKATAATREEELTTTIESLERTWSPTEFCKFSICLTICLFTKSICPLYY